MKVKTTTSAGFVPPASVQEVEQTCVQLHKLNAAAFKLREHITNIEKVLRESRRDLEGIQKTFADLKPKLDGCVSLITAPIP